MSPKNPSASAAPRRIEQKRHLTPFHSPQYHRRPPLPPWVICLSCSYQDTKHILDPKRWLTTKSGGFDSFSTEQTTFNSPDIESKLYGIIRDVKPKDGRLGHEKAAEVAVTLMPNEARSLEFINESLPGNLAKVKDLESEATEMLTSLSRLRL